VLLYILNFYVNIMTFGFNIILFTRLEFLSAVLLKIQSPGMLGLADC